MKTFSAKQSEVDQKWWIIDMDGKVLGRTATQIAVILRGKDKTIFTPHVDTGDFVVVINAEKVHLTGNKIDQKMYYRHSGFHSGLTTTSARKMIEDKPEEVIRKAVWGMLPKNRLGRQLIKKLKVYSGTTHPHAAQQPAVLDI
jgi:large subunit ribosomal protein L13